MELSVLTITETKKTDWINVKWCFLFLLLLIWLYVIGIVTCDIKIISGNVSFMFLHVFTIFVHQKARCWMKFWWLPFLLEVALWCVSLNALYIVLESSPYLCSPLSIHVTLEPFSVSLIEPNIEPVASYNVLDLEHYRCNQVYVPWVNKGSRRTATFRNVVSECGS